MKYLFIAFFLGLTQAMASSLSYKMDFHEDGTYELNFKLVKLNSSLTLSSMISNYLLNESFMKSITNNLIHQKIENFKKIGSSKFSYTLVSTMTKYGIGKDLVLNCQGESTQTTLRQDCRIDLNRSEGDLFEYGSQNTYCSFSEKSRTCDFTYTGKPKSIDYIILRRSSMRLAISGATETLISTTKLSERLCEDKSEMSTFKSNNVDPFWIAAEEESRRISKNEVLHIFSSEKGLNISHK